MTRRYGVPPTIEYVRRAHVKRSDSVLDIGCGSGETALILCGSQTGVRGTCERHRTVQPHELVRELGTHGRQVLAVGLAAGDASTTIAGTPGAVRHSDTRQRLSNSASCGVRRQAGTTTRTDTFR